MSKEFLLPELAESVVEGEILKWLVAEGEPVAEGQPLVEVMTDKVTVELPSPYHGVLEKYLVKEGDVVAVHSPIALLAERASAKVDVSETKAMTAEEGVEDEGDKLSLFKANTQADDEPVMQIRRTPEAVSSRISGPFGRVLAVPAARKLARELGINIEEVAGSGPNGRVRLDDVRSQAQQLHNAQQPASGLEERIPLRGLRRAISQQMLQSHLQSVRTLHVDEADVSALVVLREKLKTRAAARGVKLSYLAFIMKAVVASLKAFPMLNASLDEAAAEIVRKHYYHLGMAVATDAGLLVPVIHDVDKKSIVQLAAEIQQLSEKARHGKLSPDEVRGGTFSITNIGSLGGLFSFPIINVPEAAILGVHSIKKRPVVLPDDSIAARQMLYLSLSFDHRVIDGAEAAMFTSHLIDLLETPESLMLD